MMLSSSVDVPSPGGMSAVAARNVVRSSSISGAMYSLEKSPSSTGPDATGLAGNKKRRSSLGAKMVAIVGLSQWSKSTLQLNQQGAQLRILQLPCCSLSDVLVVSFSSVLLSLSQPEQFHVVLMLVRRVRSVKDDLFSALSSPSRADESQGLDVL
ncbi:Regulating synaptic membrane exocytosis protein 3 [Labeo rohita]|uniref:Regulating synaptic membrane exocytosis protein 3 n=1 Tax=Labeo rohita TaxID=84645 RepID=A0ABQ8LRP0_LABRO|nr:Regulating synaptic membrane exocytosis protein 3 [Labeo rohita]